MPELDFKITSVEAASRGIIPLLNFSVEVSSQPPEQEIHSILLQAQIQIQAPRRNYNSREKERLVELFGLPGDWGNTLRARLWANVQTAVSGFKGSTTARLSVPCSYDLNIAATKYCYALEDGDVPLLFLFSGTVFYATPEGHLQAGQISWNKESAYRLPIKAWREMMERHYPNSAWLYLGRDVFDRLYSYKRSHGLTTWEQTIERLLAPAAREEALA